MLIRFARRFTYEAMGNIFKNGLMSLASLFIITACLFVFGDGVLNYLAMLKQILSGEAAEYRRPPEVKVLYAAPYTTKLISRKLDVVDSSKGWKLVKKKQMFYIIDPDDRVRAWGSEKQMKESFDNIKEQLKK